MESSYSPSQTVPAAALARIRLPIDSNARIRAKIVNELPQTLGCV
jgi:hypothetical protein